MDDLQPRLHGSIVRRIGYRAAGVILVRTFREPDRTTFAVVHGRQPAIVLDLAGQTFDGLVVTVDNPHDAVVALT